MSQYVWASVVARHCLIASLPLCLNYNFFLDSCPFLSYLLTNLINLLALKTLFTGLSTMEITVNGDKMILDETNATITKLLLAREVESPDMVAVQINGTFLDKANYETTSVANGDQIEFLFFMGGGSR